MQRFVNTYASITEDRRYVSKAYSENANIKENIKEMIKKIMPYSFPINGQNTLNGLDKEIFGKTNSGYKLLTKNKLINKFNTICNLNLLLIYGHLLLAEPDYWLKENKTYEERMAETAEKEKLDKAAEKERKKTEKAESKKKPVVVPEEKEGKGLKPFHKIVCEKYYIDQNKL